MHFSCGIVRPPYEAGSCFLQVTSGCSHNKCRFCTFYKEAPFSVSPESEIREDLQEIRDSGWKVKRIFLQGADPFLLSYDRLKRMGQCKNLWHIFPVSPPGAHGSALRTRQGMIPWTPNPSPGRQEKELVSFSLTIG